MFGGNKEPFMSKNVIHSIGDLVFLVFNSVYSTLQNQIWVPKEDVMRQKGQCGMWVKSLEIDEPKKFGSKCPSICSEHFDRKSLKRTLKGGWRLSEGAKPLHILSSRTGFDENIYLVSNRGKVTIDIRENL